MLQDDLAQQRCRRPHRQGLAVYPFDVPVAVAAMAGGHVLGDRGVLAVARSAHVSGNALTLQEHLDSPRRQARLDGGAGMAMRNRVEVTGQFDMIVETHLAQAPLSKDVSFLRQGRQSWRVDLFEQLAPGASDVAHEALVIELVQQLADGRVDFGQTVEPSVAKFAQQPALDDAHGGLDLRLVPRPARPRRQQSRSVVSGHVAIGAVDLRIVETGLDHRHLGVVGNQQPGGAAEVDERLDVGVDPVGQGLGPARTGERQARTAHHRHEDVRAPDLAGSAVDDHRHGVAGVIHEQLVAAQMRLAHRHRQPRFPAPIEVAKPAVAVTVRMSFDILVPQDLQRDVLALQLAVQRRPIGLEPPSLAALGPGRAIKAGLESGVGLVKRQRPRQARLVKPPEHLTDRRTRDTCPPGRFTHRQTRLAGQSQHLAHMAHRNSLRRHRPLPKGKTLGPTKRPKPNPPAGSVRNGWRHHLGTGGDIKSEWLARSPRNPQTIARMPVSRFWVSSR